MKQTEDRQLTYAQAIYEATDIVLAKCPEVFLIGEGVTEPTGIFGTTKDLHTKYGLDRVMDMPVAENGVTGVCIGAAIRGMRPIMTHQRIDFSLLSLDQLINNAAKWHYMFGGQVSVPFVVRLLIGRGWGQGSQHSQSLQATFAHIPGLKVVMPTTPADAKGMLIAAVEDSNPVIFIEHRWLHGITGIVPEGYFTTDLSTSSLVRKGLDVTVITTSYMGVEGRRACEILHTEGIDVELIDARTISPIDTATHLTSVTKTGRLLVVDSGYESFGFASEIIARIAKEAFGVLKKAPQSLTVPNVPTPTSWVTSQEYYPTYLDIVKTVMMLMDRPASLIDEVLLKHRPGVDIQSDIPDKAFTGPF